MLLLLLLMLMLLDATKFASVITSLSINGCSAVCLCCKLFVPAIEPKRERERERDWDYLLIYSTYFANDDDYYASNMADNFQLTTLFITHTRTHVLQQTDMIKIRV